MKNLQLSLIRKWFEMTKLLIKPEDYRDTTPYWYSRLCLYRGVHKSRKWWKEYFECNFSSDQEARISFKHFEINIMTLGYPKSGDTERIIQFEHAGIEIRTGNPELGAEPGKLYFVIKHGKQI